MPNLRNRKLLTTIRIIFGLFMVFSGVSGFMAAHADMSGIPESMISTMHVFWQTGIFQMIKVTEIVAGLMLVVGFLPALAAIFLAPIAVGVMIFNARISPMNLPAGIIVCLFEIYLGYAYWAKYKALFVRK